MRWELFAFPAQVPESRKTFAARASYIIAPSPRLPRNRCFALRAGFSSGPAARAVFHFGGCPIHASSRQQSRWLDSGSRPAGYVRSSRLGIVSSPFREELISGARIQKLPLTHPGQVFADSAPSLLRLTGKGLTPLSSLSCSRSAVSADTRSLSHSGVSVLPPPGSRRQRAFHEPVELCTRWALRLWSGSRGGIRKSLSFRTRFESDDSAGLHGRACPARPYSRASLRCYEIESGDHVLTKSVRGLLPEASLELDGPLSWKSSFTGHGRDGW